MAIGLVALGVFVSAAAAAGQHGQRRGRHHND
jgi:hypothetical protein